jgi:hypothetical protein
VHMSTAGTILWAGCCLECPKCRFVMSDKQTIMSNDTLERFVCLRNSRMAVAAPKRIYVDEAKTSVPLSEGSPRLPGSEGSLRIKLSGALGGLSVSGLIGVQVIHYPPTGISMPPGSGPVGHWHPASLRDMRS